MSVETKSKEIQNAFIFATQTSLRLDDIRRLTFHDIRYSKDEAYLYIRQQKNKGISNMKLSKLALTIVEQQKKQNPERNNVFLLPVSRSNLNDRLREIVVLANIDKHIHFHVSRHTFATLALSRGVDIYTVSKLMGHSSVAVTEIYANLINKKKDEVADIINIDMNEDEI
jgi:integrase